MQSDLDGFDSVSFLDAATRHRLKEAWTRSAGLRVLVVRQFMSVNWGEVIPEASNIE